jgi:hypothetical protein
MLKSGRASDTGINEDTSTLGRTIMRLVLATIVAAATLTLAASPALADGERGRSGHDNNGRGHYDNGRGGERGYDRGRHNDRRDYRRDNRRDFGQYNNRGSSYWGPSARSWSRWDNSWGDPHRYARQWGFDRYDFNRGWQRGNTWYASPSAWSDWGGWNWSFSVSNGGFDNYNGYNGYNSHSNNNCAIYRTEDWINGRRAIVSYTGCSDRFGRVFEQPNSRRIERWVW